MAVKPFVDQPRVNINETVTVISASAGMDTSQIDQYRQGVNVRSPRDFRCMLSPWISDRGFPVKQRARFDPTIEPNHWGQPKLFKDPSPAFKPGVQNGPGPAPFDDIVGILNPVSYIEDPGTQQYPVVLLSPNFLDPAQMDGVIEPLSIRGSLINASIGGPVVIHSIKASMQPSNGPELLGLGVEITRFIEFLYKEHNRQTNELEHNAGIMPWVDSQNIAISEGDFYIPADGYSDQQLHELEPFNDSPPPARDPALDKYNERYFQGLGLDVEYGKFIDDPRLGIYGKSAPCGFIYRGGSYIVNKEGTGDQWVLGTDSITFGGWLR